MRFTADLVESFAGMYLSPLYDEAAPTPPMHREGWKLYCSSSKLAAIAAPREHAKSTAFTHDFVLANALFRVDPYIILVSSTEEMAIEHLGDISRELHENEELIQEFGIKKFIVDARTDIIVELVDNYQFRLIARGSGQKMRGRKWRGRRPGLIVCDDLEDDEQVESRDRRIKFRRWFFRALKPALRDGGKIRLHGTILHEDSLLARIMKDKTWKTLFYRAHKGFDDFSEILWPEKFPASRLREIRESFLQQQDAAGYSQEYLNDPFDNSDAYLQKDWFRPMEPRDYESQKIICAAADFAISKESRANRTSLTIGGKDGENSLCILDEWVGRWDSYSIVDMMFSVQEKWNPDVFWVEKGQVWKALEPILYREMQNRNRFINLAPMASITDKASRGRSLQRRMRAGSVKFDKMGEWYPGYEDEMLRFTGVSEAVLDDQFDSTALLSRGYDELAEVEEEVDFATEEETFLLRHDPRKHLGRNRVTGY